MFVDQNWNSASALLYVGNLAVQQAVTNGNTNAGVTSGNCTNSAHYYFQFYHTFGDGSVMPYVTKPEANTVTLPGTVTPDATSITVNALAGSYVAVTDNSSVIYGVAEANTSGVATVTFTNAIPSSGTLYVVVTRQQYQPYFGTIEIVGDANHAVITATANPAEGGSVNGAGVYELNESCTLTATPNTGYTFTNWKKGNTVVSTNATYTFTVTENATYTATFTAIPQYTVTIAPNTVEGGSVAFGGRGNRDEFVYDFEDITTQGWTVGSTDNGSTTWAIGRSGYTPSGSTSTVYTSHGGNYYIGSVYDASNSIDDWLISPQFTLGGTMTFYIKITNTNYTDYYSVLLSTGGAAIDQFTTTLVNATQVTSTTYTLVTVDLSSYSGEGYVAIRHTAIADQASLLVDDITIVEGEIETGEVSATYYEGETCTVTATPNEGYGFVNWTENDATVSTDANYTFTVTADRNLVANFVEATTMDLSQGSNWWTPTTTMTLEQLEAALGSNAVLINSQDAGFTRYENNAWSGTLTEIVPGQMYKIETTAPVSLTLSGAPATGVSVTLLPGYTWFGYAGAQPPDIATALGSLGVTPASGDTITDKDGHTATYNGSRWSGTLTTLQPGHGYVYLKQ